MPAEAARVTHLQPLARVDAQRATAAAALPIGIHALHIPNQAARPQAALPPRPVHQWQQSVGTCGDQRCAWQARPAPSANRW